MALKDEMSLSGPTSKTFTLDAPYASAGAAYLEEHIETMPRAQIETLQETRLMRLLEHACNNTPLIRKLWDERGLRPNDIKSLQEFKEKAPFISKQAVRHFRDTYRDPYGGLNSVGEFDLKGVTFTSGTTGDPTPVLRGIRSVSEACLMRDTWMVGSRPGDHVMVMRPTFRVGHTGYHYQEVGFIPVHLSHSPSVLPRLIAASRTYEPTSLFFLSNPLLIALETIFDAGKLDPPRNI